MKVNKLSTTIFSLMTTLQFTIDSDARKPIISKKKKKSHLNELGFIKGDRTYFEIKNDNNRPPTISKVHKVKYKLKAEQQGHHPSLRVLLVKVMKKGQSGNDLTSMKDVRLAHLLIT